MKFIASVQYIEISGGFWGLISEKGNHYRPVIFPEELKKEGLPVEIEAEEVSDVISIFMWGKSVKINSFKIIENK